MCECSHKTLIMASSISGARLGEPQKVGRCEVRGMLQKRVVGGHPAAGRRVGRLAIKVSLACRAEAFERRTVFGAWCLWLMTRATRDKPTKMGFF